MPALSPLNYPDPLAVTSPEQMNSTNTSPTLHNSSPGSHLSPLQTNLFLAILR
ncbi:hypothetical protein HYDPIDRAFT_112663 [Hydnomerulius pinastri MD-312]|uniref:Uncharacterized protein n=1 Tax=Hydnomerulius pinastri MD-312 TaxID=994086 RepID=A0A0C9WFD6_9AGAM|nr:hypothetical protein HYDPIDRAFT_112663 [Hydnomerulius pinastri MD-312]